jgi:putative transposase
MVRAGVVKHPAEWPFCGYNEIQRPKERYALIDYNGLKDIFSCREISDVRLRFCMLFWTTLSFFEKVFIGCSA